MSLKPNSAFIVVVTSEEHSEIHFIILKKSMAVDLQQITDRPKTDYHQGEKYPGGLKTTSRPRPLQLRVLWPCEQPKSRDRQPCCFLPGSWAIFCLASGKTETLPGAEWTGRCLADAFEGTLLKCLSAKRWHNLAKAAKSQ